MKTMGQAITGLLNREDLCYEESYELFRGIILNRETEMQQGAFLAALTAKGASPEEIRGIWRAIMDFDTTRSHPQVEAPLVENTGTGMDRVKTFNVSTAAALVASACGVAVARHGSRSITSKMGTVDLAEHLGVDVEADVGCITRSIEQAGIGLFNGGSPQVHPTALARILGNISFGSVLNTAASLANPAGTRLAVRGVNLPAAVRPVAEIMRAIGYERAIVVHGLAADGSPALDEAGNIGDTLYALLEADGHITEGRFSPGEMGLATASADAIRTTGDAKIECRRFVSILAGRGRPEETDIVALNAALLLFVAGKAATLPEGVAPARQAMESGAALDRLRRWVACQNTREAGAAKQAGLDALLLGHTG